MQSEEQGHQRLWIGCDCGGAAGEQQPDYTAASFAPVVVGRDGRALEPRSFAPNVSFSFDRLLGAFSARFCFLEHIEGTAEVQLRLGCRLGGPCSG